jgi:hypothetical protein
MSLRDEKAELLQNQVTAKLHWGTDEEEISQFLAQKGIGGAEADRLLANARRSRARAIRVRALWTLLFAVIGLVVPVWYFGLQMSANVIVVGRASAVMFALAMTCLYYLLRSLYRILRGETVGPVDRP